MAHKEHVLRSTAVRVPSAAQATGSHERIRASAQPNALVEQQNWLPEGDPAPLFRGAHTQSGSGAHSQKKSPGRVDPDLDPDQAINRKLSQYQKGLPDWMQAGISVRPWAVKAQLWWTQLIEAGLLPTSWKGVELELPANLRFTFEPGSKKELGHYKWGRSQADGTRFNININLRAHFLNARSEAQLVQVILHEGLHLCEDIYRQKKGKKPPRGDYHSKELRALAERLGIPCTAQGRDLGIRPGGLFESWCAGQQISQVPVEPPAPSSETKTRRPKRVVWHCQCADKVQIMVPRGSVIDFLCQRCKAPLQVKEAPPTQKEVNS